VTEAQFIPSADALRLVVGACGDEVSAAEILLEWAKADELAATARTHRTAHEGGPILTARDKLLTAEDWDWFDEIAPQAFKSGIVSRTGWDTIARNTVTVRMTGLHFEEGQLAGLVLSLPARIVPIAQEVSVPVEDRGEWVSARDAVRRIMGATGQGPIASLDAIVAYVRTGDIKARALVLTEDTHRQGAGKRTEEMRDAPVPLWFWGDFTTRGSANFNWQSGVFTGHGFRGANQVTVTLTGVQFDARGLDLLDPSPKPEAASRTPHAGRPAAEWWDDLLIEMFRRLWEDRWSPRTQADLVRAMHEWLAQNPGDDPAKPREAGDTTLELRARKLFKALGLGQK
jgi:hypothetical protein